MKRFLAVLSTVLISVFSYAPPAPATVASSTSRVQYSCNGSTTGFAFTFGVAETSDLQVILTDASSVETTLTETTHYSVSCTLSDCANGGTVTTVATYAAGNTITIVRNIPLTQETDFVEGMPTLYASFENALDKLTRLIQQLNEKFGRTPMLPSSSSISNPVLPVPGAGSYLGWNAAGTALENKVASTITVGELAVIGDYSDNLATAISTIGSTPKLLIINKAVTLTANATVPSTLTLWITSEGSIVKASTYTLTINGPLTVSDRHQIFSGFSAGNVTFASGIIDEVYPEWWGAKGDNSTDDATAISCAISSLSAGTVKLGPKVYRHSTALSLAASYVGIEGVDWLQSVLRSTSATLDGVQITSTTTGNFIRKLKIDKVSTTPTSGIGISISGASQPTISDVEIRNYTTGIKTVGTSNLIAERVNVFRTAGTDTARGFWIDGTTANPSATFHKCLAYFPSHSGTNYGFYLYGTSIQDCNLEFCEADQVMYGFYIGSGGATNYNVHLVSPISDQFTNSGIYVANNTTSDNMLISITGGWTNPYATGATTYNVNVASASGVSITNHQFFAGGNYTKAIGLYLSTVYRVKAIGNHFSNFLYPVSGAGTNLQNQLIGNDFYNVSGQTATAMINAVSFSRGAISNNVFDGYATAGIALDANSGYNSVIGNAFNPTNITTKISNSGSANQIDKNTGFVTSNHGVTAAIASGTAVAHGMDATPTSVVASAAETGPTDIYITEVGATTFKINFGAGGSKTFYWSARVY